MRRIAEAAMPSTLILALMGQRPCIPLPGQAGLSGGEAHRSIISGQDGRFAAGKTGSGIFPRLDFSTKPVLIAKNSDVVFYLNSSRQYSYSMTMASVSSSQAERHAQ